MQLLPFVELRLHDQLEDSVSLCSHPGRGSTQNIPGHHPMETPLFVPPSLALQMSPAPKSEEPPRLLLLRCASSQTQMRAPTGHLSQAPHRAALAPLHIPTAQVPPARPWRAVAQPCLAAGFVLPPPAVPSPPTGSFAVLTCHGADGA